MSPTQCGAWLSSSAWRSRTPWAGLPGTCPRHVGDHPQPGNRGTRGSSPRFDTPDHCRHRHTTTAIASSKLGSRSNVLTNPGVYSQRRRAHRRSFNKILVGDEEYPRLYTRSDVPFVLRVTGFPLADNTTNQPNCPTTGPHTGPPTAGASLLHLNARTVWLSKSPMRRRSPDRCMDHPGPGMFTFTRHTYRSPVVVSMHTVRAHPWSRDRCTGFFVSWHLFSKCSTMLVTERRSSSCLCSQGSAETDPSSRVSIISSRAGTSDAVDSFLSLAVMILLVKIGEFHIR
jgi:hypothetical protein